MTAEAQARAVTTANRVLDQPIAAAEVTVTFPAGGRLVRVEVLHPVETYFARVIGVDQVTVRGDATAEADTHATAAACAKPWFMPNTILSTLPACEACAASPPQVFIANGAVTDWAIGHYGDQFTLKPNNPAASLAPGQFYAIRMGDSTGGNDYRDNISSCSQQQIRCQQTYGAEPGNMIGPTVQGVRDLIGPFEDTYLAAGPVPERPRRAHLPDEPSAHHHSRLGRLQHGGLLPHRRVAGRGANVQIPVVGFAQVFLVGVQGNDVIGRLVGVSACDAGGGSGGGASGGGGSTGEIGPYGVLVRLVRTE